MNIKLYIIFLLSIEFIISSCANSTHHSNNNSFEYKYKIARNKLFHKHYIEAIQELTNIQKMYPFDPYPQQIYLDLIYAYYKTYDLKSANDSIQNFLKLYPNHQNLDYVLYMHGIINMSLDKNNTFFFIKNLNINQYNCNSNYANIAFDSFLRLIQNYPNSQYYMDSYTRLIILKNKIAEYELSVIKFYYDKHAYISVIARTEKMLRYFSDTQATQKALYYMEKAYQNIRLLEQAKKIHAIITENLKTY